MSFPQLYISKRCPYCRKLLMILKQHPELRGNFKITCIDNEPFPNVIKSVPSMIINNEILTSDEIFQNIQESLEQQSQQQQNVAQAQIPKPQENNPENEPDDIMGVCENGFCSGFESFDSSPTNYDNFASIDHVDTSANNINVKDDGYINNNKKTQHFDNDYERMMQERGEIGNGTGHGQRPMV
tara:strand:- start:382 stop:933 length:552 start_codon:yes stop_codon:yes gene_type:complete